MSSVQVPHAAPNISAGASKDNKVPALVWVHGGPGGQTRQGYSATRQHLINHGYAILGATLTPDTQAVSADTIGQAITATFHPGLFHLVPPLVVVALGWFFFGRRDVREVSPLGYQYATALYTAFHADLEATDFYKYVSSKSMPSGDVKEDADRIPSESLFFQLRWDFHRPDLWAKIDRGEKIKVKGKRGR